MLNFFNKIFLSIFLVFLIISILFVPILYSISSEGNFYQDEYSDEILLSNNGFFWPIPGYTHISSYFGKRVSPTSMASTYHSGIDIPASQNTNLYAIEDGIITFASWGAGGGYTVVLKLTNYPNISVSYCHVSPIFLVKRNQEVKRGELIAKVGPKYVYGINNNPYKDANGKPTNGATTGCHLHLTIKENGVAVNPLKYYRTKVKIKNFHSVY